MPAQAQSGSDWVNKYWDAGWITMPGKNGREYGVYHFRKTFLLAGTPDSFIVRVSADNRYRLFVNGQIAGNGYGCDIRFRPRALRSNGSMIVTISHLICTQSHSDLCETGIFTGRC